MQYWGMTLSVKFVVITSAACARVDNFFSSTRTTILIVFLLISYLFRCNLTFLNAFSQFIFL